jgi:hypothetical protein
VFYPFLMAWHILLYRADEWRTGDRPGLLRWHAAFWDEYQRLPWFGLDEHVVLVAERHPQEGQVALDYLGTSRQRWAAQAAQIELDARQLERCADITGNYYAPRSWRSKTSRTLPCVGSHGWPMSKLQYQRR